MTDRYSFSSYLTNGMMTVFGVLTVQEWYAAVGILLGLLTFAVTVRRRIYGFVSLAAGRPDRVSE